MEYLDNIVNTISLSMGVAWASGINLYATLLVLGILGATGNMALPPALEMLTDPMVIMAAGFMYLVEFFADKVPGVDTGWDTVHTFIRIPAGVALAGAAVGEVNPPLLLAAAIVGGGVTTASHLTKSGSRVIINTSPEPFTNWAASVAEDVAVIAGLWAALNHPVLFLALLALFLVLLVWLLPKIWRGIKKVFAFIGRLFGGGGERPGEVPRIGDGTDSRGSDAAGDVAERLKLLDDLLEGGRISESEHAAKKREILETL